MDKALGNVSGHWGWYSDNMFAIQSATAFIRRKTRRLTACALEADELSPAMCSSFKHGLRSYRDLPMRLAEFGIVHRYEPSGALHGVMRVRAFTQDDAHIFCTEDQLAEMREDQRPDPVGLRDFGFGRIVVKLSTARRSASARRHVGSRRRRDGARARARSRPSTATSSRRRSIRAKAFYGPKFEYVLRDAIGRDWQCGTTQVDFNLPERFGAFYIDAEQRRRFRPAWCIARSAGRWSASPAS